MVEDAHTKGLVCTKCSSNLWEKFEAKKDCLHAEETSIKLQCTQQANAHSILEGGSKQCTYKAVSTVEQVHAKAACSAQHTDKRIHTWDLQRRIEAVHMKAVPTVPAKNHVILF